MTTQNRRSSHATELPQGEAPAWVHLLPAGEFSGRDGRGPYQTNAKSILAEFAAWGMPLALDYEHQGINSADNGKPAPAAGWITELESRKGEIWGKVEWTDTATGMIAAREYRYLSPVFDYNTQGAVIRIVGAGLTNNPNLYLTAIAKRDAHTQEKAMNDLTERLCYMLNLPVTSTAEEITAHLQRVIDSLKTSAATVAQMREMLGVAADAAPEQLAQSLQSRLAQAEPDPARYVPFAEFERVSHAHSALLSERNQEVTDRLVAQAMASGKVSPGMEAWAREYCARDRHAFEQYVSASPVLVQPGAALPGDPPKTAAHTVNPLLADAERRAEAEQM